jgi:hypothetical protein
MLQRKTVGEVFKAISEAPDREGVIQLLKDYGNNYLNEYIRFMLDSNVSPDFFGVPSYKVNQMPTGMSEANLYEVSRRLYIFDKKRNAHIKERNKLMILQTLLMGLNPVDAEFLIALLKNEACPKNLTREIVKSVFPNLLTDIERETIDNGTDKTLPEVQPDSGTPGANNSTKVRRNSKRK